MNSPIPLDQVRSIDQLWPNPLVYPAVDLMRHVRSYDREALRSHYLRQSILGAEVWANYVVNLWEYERGVQELTSRPWNITIPITEVCNAKCTFCSSPLVPAPEETTVEQIRYFGEALRYAIRVSLQGLGEPLAHPQFEAIAEEIKKYLNPVASLEMITNGWLLSGHRYELLKEIRLHSLQISVNAASDRTHQIAMGSKPGTFDRVLKNIEGVLADKDGPPWAKVSMVITRHSLPEVEQFLELFTRMGLKFFQFNALLPITTADWGFGHLQQYLDLWCGYLPNAAELVAEAQQAIAAYRKKGLSITATPEQWLQPIDQRSNRDLVQLSASPSAPREMNANSPDEVAADMRVSAVNANGLPQGTLEDHGPNKAVRIYCPMVYNTLSVFHHSLDVSTCCYMETAPGHEHPSLKGQSLSDAYNDAGFRLVRRSLHANRRIPVCESCPYDGVRRAALS